MAFLEVDQLQLRLRSAHGAWVSAVRDVSFTMERGQTLGLIGESGCGKSLTALSLMGLWPEGAQLSGRMQLEGQDLLSYDDRAWCALRGNRVAMIFQEPMTALNPLMRIGAQVAEPMVLHRGTSRAQALTQAVALLDRVGIPDAARRSHDYPHQFSGGQRQRIMIAMALACEPALLIADEPTTALDVTVQAQILELINELVQERGMGLLLISHDLGVMARQVSRLMVMYGGTVVESGVTAQVLRAPRHPYTQGLMSARPRLGAAHRAKLPTIAGSVPELAHLPAGCPFTGRCPQAVEQCGGDFPLLQSVGEVDASSGLPHTARCWRLVSKPGVSP